MPTREYYLKSCIVQKMTLNDNHPIIFVCCLHRYIKTLDGRLLNQNSNNVLLSTYWDLGELHTSIKIFWENLTITVVNLQTSTTFLIYLKNYFVKNK